VAESLRQHLEPQNQHLSALERPQLGLSACVETTPTSFRACLGEGRGVSSGSFIASPAGRLSGSHSSRRKTWRRSSPRPAVDGVRADVACAPPPTQTQSDPTSDAIWARRSRRCLITCQPVTLETLFSITMLGGFIWAVRFLLPRAVRAHDPMALTCAVLTAALALLMWLLVGVGTRSVP
jgi:hypothetical protein